MKIDPEELRYLTALRPQIAERTGPEEDNDLIWCDECGKVFCWYSHPNPDVPYLSVPLPMPMPGVDPNRTLWGMVDWDMWRKHIADDGEMALFEDIERINQKITGWNHPYLTLLKALAHQRGVEVKE